MYIVGLIPGNFPGLFSAQAASASTALNSGCCSSSCLAMLSILRVLTFFKTRFARYKKVKLVKCPISRQTPRKYVK